MSTTVHFAPQDHRYNPSKDHIDPQYGPLLMESCCTSTHVFVENAAYAFGAVFILVFLFFRRHDPSLKAFSATALYWVVFAGAVVLLLYALWETIQGLGNRVLFFRERMLICSPAAVTEIPYSSIEDVTCQSIGGARKPTVAVSVRNGEPAVLEEVHFPQISRKMEYLLANLQ